MQLKNHIFLWVSLATLAPLTALVLGATVYSERLYRQRVSSEVLASLSGIVAEIDRRLLFEREMLQGLVDAPAVRQFVPVLKDAAQGRLHPEFFPRSEVINAFLEDFQEIVGSFNTLRILDVGGNTLVKVRGGRRSPAVFDGIESFPYAEEELDDQEFLRRLQELTYNEVGAALLTRTRQEQGEEGRMPMMDYIVPFAIDGGLIGYLTANIRGEQIDRILDLAPRMQAGQLVIAEINPEQWARNGLLLYDDTQRLRFADIKSTNTRLQDLIGEAHWRVVQDEQTGTFRTPGGQAEVYFADCLPYPNLLAHWVVASFVETGAITGPFARIRFAIALFAGAALLLSLWFARLTASRIARPVTRLAASLKAYADGNYRIRVTPKGSDETAQLADAFNYMADTLDSARCERDRAQKMMVQAAKLASLGEMAAGIGHEINNPLSNILSYAKLIERGVAANEGELARDAAALREEALRASEIVKGVLNFARQVPPHYSGFEVSQWVRETCALVRRSARARRVELIADLSDDITIEGDRGQLQQALVNLLLNAIQASPVGGQVEVKVQVTDSELTVSVHDQGSGIDDAVLDKVFDPFFTTKPVGESTGLGLSISLGIIERHGGGLRLQNNPGGGLTAYMILPRESRRLHERTATDSVH